MTVVNWRYLGKRKTTVGYTNKPGSYHSSPPKPNSAATQPQSIRDLSDPPWLLVVQPAFPHNTSHICPTMGPLGTLRPPQASLRNRAPPRGNWRARSLTRGGQSFVPKSKVPRGYQAASLSPLLAFARALRCSLMQDLQVYLWPSGGLRVRWGLFVRG